MKSLLRNAFRCGAAAGLAFAASALAQSPDSAARMAEQRAAMAKLSFMEGIWRGQATVQSQDGTHVVTQTERMGPMLDGTITVIEGKGFNPDGTVGFNAFAIVSFDPDADVYSMRSYTGGRAGDFRLTPTADGYVWEIPAGPTTIRYTAAIKDGHWKEVGDRIAPGQPPVRFFEMDLVRVGDTDWPGGGGPGAK